MVRNTKTLSILITTLYKNITILEEAERGNYNLDLKTKERSKRTTT